MTLHNVDITIIEETSGIIWKERRLRKVSMWNITKAVPGAWHKLYNGYSLELLYYRFTVNEQIIRCDEYRKIQPWSKP